MFLNSRSSNQAGALETIQNTYYILKQQVAREFAQKVYKSDANNLQPVGRKI